MVVVGRGCPHACAGQPAPATPATAAAQTDSTVSLHSTRLIIFHQSDPYRLCLQVWGFFQGSQAASPTCKGVAPVPGGVYTGRPVDVQQLPDGSVVFSSDAPTGAVFRLSYVGA